MLFLNNCIPFLKDSDIPLRMNAEENPPDQITMPLIEKYWVYVLLIPAMVNFLPEFEKEENSF